MSAINPSIAPDAVDASRRANITRVTVVVIAGEDRDLAPTLQSLAQQEEVQLQVIVTGADRGLRDHLSGCDADFVTIVRSGDILLRTGVRIACHALHDAPNAAMAHPLWMPSGPDGLTPHHATRQHLKRLRDVGASAVQSWIARSRLVPPLATFRANWLVGRPELEHESLERAVGRLFRELSVAGRVTTVMTVACASAALPAYPPERSMRAMLWGALEKFAPEFRRAKPGAAIWDAFGAFLRRRAFAGLAMPSRRRRPAEQAIAYYQPRYPALSETFILREVRALRDAGVRLQVFALERGASTLVDAEAMTGVTWFGPENLAAGRAFIMAELRRAPWRVIALALWMVRSGREGWWRNDLGRLYLAGQLAGALERAQITHVHAPWADRHSVVAFVAARLVRATFSVQARASEIHRVTSGRGIADRLRFAEFVITNSTYNKRHLRTVMHNGAPSLHVIRNGLDLGEFPPRVPLARDDTAFRLLAVGRLVEPKGFRYLLHACRELLDRGHDFTCEIIGGPADPLDTVTWVELVMLHERLRLGSRVVFRGPQSFEAVMNAYGWADAFVLPCVRGRDGSHDITPNSLIEAMAMQLPVVSTTSGAIPEIVDHDVNGLLVAPGDASPLADALERLMRDPALRVQLGEAARRKVEDLFDASRNAALRVRLFESLRTQDS